MPNNSSQCPLLPSPPANNTSTTSSVDNLQYVNMVLSYNYTSGSYLVSPIRKAFRVYLNMSYNLNVKNNKATFVSSIQCALALFFGVPLPTGNQPNGNVYIKSLYNSSWPSIINVKHSFMGSDYTVVEFSSSVATNFTGNYSYLPYLNAWWSNPLNYWTAITCDPCPAALCTCATLPISFWSSNTWFLNTWFSSDAALKSARPFSLYGERIDESPPLPSTSSSAFTTFST